jgi:hypothetical protein
MTSPYEREARPWDLYNKNLGRVSEEIMDKRISICKECPEFISFTMQCKVCKCFMNFKTKLPNAECPLKKWGQEVVPLKEKE